MFLKYCIPVSLIYKTIIVLVAVVFCIGLMRQYYYARFFFIFAGLSVLWLIWRKSTCDKCNIPPEIIDLATQAELLWLNTEKEELSLRNSDKETETQNDDMPPLIGKDNQLFIGEIINDVGYSKKFTPLLYRIFADIEKNKDLPSVSSNYLSDPENEVLEKNNTFMLLRDITIEKHTRNVILAAMEIAKATMGRDLYAINIWPLIICAAAHDLGKITRQTGEVDARKHHAMVSAEIIGDMLEDTNCEPLIKKRITSAVSQHHRQGNMTQEASILTEYLVKADWHARAKEVELLDGRRTTPYIDNKNLTNADHKREKVEKIQTEWQTELLANFKDSLWTAFIKSVAQSKNVYFYDGIAYFDKEAYELFVNDFFLEKKQLDFHRKSQYKADDNVASVNSYLKKLGLLLSRREYDFSLIDIQFGSATSGRWKKKVPCYAIKKEAFNVGDQSIYEFVKSTAKLNAISKIIFSSKEDKN